MLQVIPRRPMPSIRIAIAIPPPAAAFLSPNPATTGIRPASAVHRQRRHEKGVLLSIFGNAFADDKRIIADRYRFGQDLEITTTQITEAVQIEHLTSRIEERVLRLVTQGRTAHNHPKGRSGLPAHADSRTRRPAERVQVGYAVDPFRVRLLRVGARAREKK